MNTYESLTDATIKAQHIIELRQAVNAICGAIGAPNEYPASDLLLSALQGQPVHASDLVTLMTHINNIRTNALIAAASASFTETPVVGLVIKAQHLLDLRSALQ